MFRIFHYLDEVYREQSFSRAAQKLYLSQPSLSLTIKRYENEIGVQIFDRSTTPVKLTEAGEVVMEYIQRILATQRDMEAYLEDYRELRTGDLTLSAAHMFSSYLLPRLTARFLHLCPEIDVKITESDFLSLQQMTLNGDVDLLIESHDFEPSLFQIYPLFEEHILLAVPANDPANAENAACMLRTEDVLQDRHVDCAWPCVALERFREHPFLMLEKGHDMHSRGLRFCRESGFEPKVFMYLNQLTTACNLAAQRLGVTFVSDTTVKLTNLGGELVYYKLPGPNVKRWINMVHKRNRYVSKAAAAFIAMATEFSHQGISSLCWENDIMAPVCDSAPLKE